MVEDESFVHESAKFNISSESQSTIRQYLKENPTSTSQNHNVTRKAETNNNFQPFALTCEPTVPPKNDQADPNIQQIRKNLTIHGYRDKIISAIDNNRILLVQGR